MNRTAPTGFTLVEALIAATIFFASIVVVSEAYRANITASRKAEMTARVLAPLPILMSQIQDRLRDAPEEDLSLKGSLFGVAYDAHTRINRRAAPPARIDLDSGVNVKFRPRFVVYDVNLSLAIAGHRQTITYEELAWSRAQIGE